MFSRVFVCPWGGGGLFPKPPDLTPPYLSNQVGGRTGGSIYEPTDPTPLPLSGR